MMRRSGCRRAGDGMGWDVIKGGRRSLKSEAGRSHFWAAKWRDEPEKKPEPEANRRDGAFCGRTSAQGIADCWLGFGLRVENVLVTPFSSRVRIAVNDQDESSKRSRRRRREEEPRST